MNTAAKTLLESALRLVVVHTSNRSLQSTPFLENHQCSVIKSIVKFQEIEHITKKDMETRFEQDLFRYFCYLQNACF